MRLLDKIRDALRTWLKPDWSAPAAPVERKRKPMKVRVFAKPPKPGEVDAGQVFAPYAPPKGVVPDGAPVLAMDELPVSIWPNYTSMAFSGDTDLVWLGYPILSQLAQRVEYRMVVETFAREATREWIKFTASEEKKDYIAALTDEFKNFDVQGHVRDLIEKDGYFGRGHLYIDLGNDSADEVRTPLAMDGTKIKGKLKGFKVIEPVWTYPFTWNSSNPLGEGFYSPEAWYVLGKLTHGTRLLPLITRPVPDLLKPAYAFGGLSLTQLIRPYVDNWLRTRQSVSDKLHNYSVAVWKTNMEGALGGGAWDDIDRRADMFNQYRDQRGVFVLDKEDEDFVDVSSPISGLAELQNQSRECIAAAARMPNVVLWGIEPGGLNSSAEGQLDAWDDYILAFCVAHLYKIIRIMMYTIMVNKWGRVDPTIDFTFNAIKQMTAKEQMEIEKIKAEIDGIYLEKGAIDGEDVRDRLEKDEDSLYSGMTLRTPEPLDGGDDAQADDFITDKT